jgi:Calx-beta domain
VGFHSRLTDIRYVDQDSAIDVTTEATSNARIQTVRASGFRSYAERGAAAVEMAVAGLLLATLALGGGEYGLLMSSKHDLNVATRLAGRIASSPCATTGTATLKGILLDPNEAVPSGADTRPRTGGCEDSGNTEFDDFYILRAIESGLGGKISDVQKVIIYKAIDSDVLNIGRVPAVCLNDDLGQQALCNVYTKDTPLVGANGKTLLTNLDYFYVQTGDQTGALIGQKLADNFGCGDSRPTTAKLLAAYPFCPTRTVSQTNAGITKSVPIRLRNISNATPLGIYIKMKHQFVTGFFRDNQMISDWTVFRLEPSPKVNETQKDPCSGASPPPGCHQYPKINLSASPVTEGDLPNPTPPNCADVTVTLSPSLTTSESVTFSTSPGTAVTPKDFKAKSVTLTFLPGQTQKNVCVEIVGDTIFEPTTGFRVQVTNASGGLLDGSGVLQGVTDIPITIYDNDVPPQLTIDDITAMNEGTEATFTVSLNAISDQPTTFNYETKDGSALLANADYEQWTIHQGIIPANQMSVQIKVKALKDGVLESDETFQVVLSDPSSNVQLAAKSVGTAIIKDYTIQLNIDLDKTVIEGQKATFTARIDKLSSTPIIFTWFTTDETAKAGLGDYTAVAGGTGTIPANSYTTTFDVQTLTDAFIENGPDEKYTVAVSNPSGAILGSNPTRTGFITDGTPDISVNSVSVDEGSTATVMVSLNKISSVPVTFQYKTVDGTGTYGATSGSGDYDAISPTTITIPAGSLNYTFTVKANPDNLVETTPETFQVVLSNVVNAGLGTVTGTVTIIDKTTTISVGNVTILEGGTANVTLTITNPSTTGSVTFNYASQPGSAVGGASSGSGIDYLSFSGFKTAGPNTTTVTIPVNAETDNIVDNNETYKVLLSNVVGAVVTNATGTVTITDATSTISIVKTKTLLEGASSTLKVSLDKASPVDVTFSYNSVNGTAVAGASVGTGDYDAISSSTYTIPANTTSMNIAIKTNNDLILDDGEFFTVVLSGITGAATGNTTSTVTITDNSPVLTINDITVNENGTADFTVSLNKASTIPVTFNYNTVNGTALAGAPGVGDYTAIGSSSASIPVGSLTKTITVTALKDLVVDPNEYFDLLLANIVGAGNTKSSGRATIIDLTPVINIADVSVAEGSTATVTVTLTHASPDPVTFTYKTVNGTATAGLDYNAVAQTTYTIPAGTTVYSFPVVTLADGINDPNETVTVPLVSVTGAVAGTNGTITITENSAIISINNNVNNITVNEGGTASFAITLSKPSTVPVTFTYTTRAGTATAGTDYATVTGTITIPVGSTTVSIPVSATTDNVTDPGEVFYLDITNIMGAVGPTTLTGTATIIDKSTAVSVSIGTPAAVSESSGTINFPITLSKPSTVPLTFVYSTFNGTAVGGSCPNNDFVSVSSQTFTVPANTTSINLPITICNDAVYEPTESFTVTISNPQISGATTPTVGTATGTGTITNDDPLPTVSVSPGSASEGANISFTVNLSAPSSGNVTVNLSVTPGTATSADYGALSAASVVIPAGSTRATVTILARTDSLVEPTETFTITATPSGPVSTSPASGTMSINDVPPVVVTTAPPTVVVTTVAPTTSTTTTPPTTVAATTPPTTVAVTTVSPTTVAPTTASGTTTTIKPRTGNS